MLKKVLHAFIPNKDNLNEYVLFSYFNLLRIVLEESIKSNLQESSKAGILFKIYAGAFPGSVNYLFYSSNEYVIENKCISSIIINSTKDIN